MRKEHWVGVKCVTLLVWSAVLGTGCVSWKPQWHKAGDRHDGPAPAKALRAAHDAMNQANSAEALLESLQAFHKVVSVDPDNYHSLISLSNQYILMGGAYTRSRYRKTDYFQLARFYAEMAMYTNPAFRRRVDLGETPWQACNALNIQHMEAMLFWVTAVFYQFKEGWSVPGKIANLKWMRYCDRILTRMEAIDPDWGGGAVHMSRGIYYFIESKSRGGDIEKALAAANRAVAVGPNWLLNRWGRAKYFWRHPQLRNRELFIADLEWILRQDIDTVKGVYPWKAYIMRDARFMLDHVDDYF